jgi:hypothetical protein
MSRKGRTYVSNGEVDLYQDQQSQVCVARVQRTVVITAVAGGGGAQTPLVQLRNQAIGQTRITKCVVIKTKQGSQRRISAVPVLPNPLVGKVNLIEYWLDGRTDALQKMTMYYPAGTRMNSASMVLQGQSWKANDPAVDVAPVRQVLGPDNKRLPAYRTYELQDLRNG